MRCTPAESATSRVREALVHAVGRWRGRCRARRRPRCIACSTSSMPTTLRKVSCWPAKDASGRSSAVAEERTAKLALGVAGGKPRRTRARISASSAGGSGCVLDPARGSPRRRRRARARRRRRARRGARRCARARPPCARKSRKACAVVAKPPGHAHAGCGQLADHLAEARRSCRRPPRRRSFSGSQTGRPGRSPSKGADMGKLEVVKNRCHPTHAARRRALDRRTAAGLRSSTFEWRRWREAAGMRGSKPVDSRASGCGGIAYRA